MQIRINGSNMDIGDALSQYIRDNLEKEVTKYFNDAVDAQVNFTKEASEFKVVILVNEGIRGSMKVKSDGKSSDAYSAFNQAKERATKQLRRYKRKITNHHKRIDNQAIDFLNSIYESPKYVISERLNEDNQHDDNRDSKESNNFNIITEKTTDIETITIDQAMMKMNLADLPALVFVNAKDKNLNVIYHRKDGNISLIDLKVKY